MMTYTPTQAEKQELADIQAYLQGHARNGTLDRLPEGSIAGVLNRASTSVRAQVLKNRLVVEHVIAGGRSEPFQPRLEIDWSKVDKPTEAIAAQARTEDYSHSLMNQMGTTPEPSGPPDLRDTLTAAMDASEGGAHD